MKGHHETEIKLEVRDRRALRRQLAKLGFRVIRPRHFERNVLFDFEDQRLWKARCLLRLRLAGNRWTLTFKGTPLQSRHYKIRREIETELKDGSSLREILEALGLREVFRYEKYRTVYSQPAGVNQPAGPALVLDETPIGDYLELEGPERWIDRVARQLGYRHEDYIRASYATLYRQKCRARGQEPGNMVFERSPQNAC